MRHLLLALLIALLAADAAIAQPAAFQPGRSVTDANPYPVKIIATLDAGMPPTASSTSSAGTVASNGVFQSALAASASRRGCMIQNKSVSDMQIYLGAPGAASSAASITLPAGGIFSCSSPAGVVISDQISVTGATSAAFVVIAQ